MRIPFSSQQFPLESADRLAFLLPALSPEQARDWTAQVYGYQNWSQLLSNVGAQVPAAVAALEPKHAPNLDAYQVSTAYFEYGQAGFYQREILSDLMELTGEAAEDLYATWNPMESGSFSTRKVAHLGDGGPAYRLLQQNVFRPEESCGQYGEFDRGAVYDGYPGTPAEQAAAVDAFISRLPSRVQENDGAELAIRLRKGFSSEVEVRSAGRPGSFTQIRRITFFAIDETEGVDIIAAAPVTFALSASSDGAHSVKVTLEQFVTVKSDEEVDFSMASAIATALWHSVSRYIWCTLGNTDREALVQVEHRPRHMREKECAETVAELLASHSGWPNTDDRPEDYGIVFAVTSQARSGA